MEMHDMHEWSPKKHQKMGIRKLLGQTAAGLFLDPGLGKTSTVLAAFKILKEKGLVKKMLVVAPLRPVYSVWPVEVSKWMNFVDISISILHGPMKDDRIRDSSDVHVINPEGLKWLWEHNAIPDYDILCIDESTKFKNSTSQRFKMLKKNIDRFPRRWILTGSPAPRGIENLFSQIYILDHGRALGRYISHFRMEFMFQPNPWEKYKWEVKEGAMEEISERVTPLILRLKAEDYLDMPTLLFNDIFVTLPPAAMKLYSEVEDDFIANYGEGFIVAGNAAAAGTKCRQIANGAVYTEDGDYVTLHDEKLTALKDLVDELGGKSILLIYEYKHDIARILEEKGLGVVALGDLSPKKGDEAIALFNQGGISIMAVHPASAAHGLNMQECCHHVVFFGLTWDLELYDQVIKRIWRQGQKMPVTVHRLLAKGTKDEQVARVLIQKDATQEEILEAITAKL